MPLTSAGETPLPSWAARCHSPGPAQLPEVGAQIPSILSRAQPGPLLSAWSRWRAWPSGDWVMLLPPRGVDEQEAPLSAQRLSPHEPGLVPSRCWPSGGSGGTGKSSPPASEMPQTGREGLGRRGPSQRQKHEWDRMKKDGTLGHLGRQKLPLKTETQPINPFLIFPAGPHAGIWGQRC